MEETACERVLSTRLAFFSFLLPLRSPPLHIRHRRWRGESTSLPIFPFHLANQIPPPPLFSITRKSRREPLAFLSLLSPPAPPFPFTANHNSLLPLYAPASPTHSLHRPKNKRVSFKKNKLGTLSRTRIHFVRLFLLSRGRGEKICFYKGDFSPSFPLLPPFAFERSLFFCREHRFL